MNCWCQRPCALKACNIASQLAMYISTYRRYNDHNFLMPMTILPRYKQDHDFALELNSGVEIDALFLRLWYIAIANQNMHTCKFLIGQDYPKSRHQKVASYLQVLNAI